MGSRHKAAHSCYPVLLGILLSVLWISANGRLQADLVVDVSATSAIYLAAQPNGTTLPGGDIAPTNSPVFISLTSFRGNPFLSFSVTGATSRDPNLNLYPLVGPDGEFGALPINDHWYQPPVFVLSGMAGPFSSLVGVLIDSSQTFPVPPDLDFGSPEKRAFATLAPMLQRLFFIGDGLTGVGMGDVQLFQIPTGADALYLGLFDSIGENNNNVGQLRASITAAPVPEPAILLLLGIGTLGLMGCVWRRCNISLRTCLVNALVLVALFSSGALSEAYGGPLIGDPVLWLRADAGVTTDGSGGVSAWADQSGAGHDASQAAPSSRAQLVPGVLNGNPVLHFNGSTSFLNVTGQVVTSQRFTIFAVVNDLGLSDYTFREVFSNWNPISNEATSVFFGLAHENPARARLTDNFGGADPPYSQQGVGEITNPANHFIFTGVSGLTDALIYQNTDLIAEKGGPLTTRNLAAPYHIGQQGPEGLLEHWNGDIAEILVYDRELAADERQQVWNYLGEKYLAAPIPEPSTLALLGIGTLGLITWARRQRAEKRAQVSAALVACALVNEPALRSALQGVASGLCRDSRPHSRCAEIDWKSIGKGFRL